MTSMQGACVYRFISRSLHTIPFHLPEGGNPAYCLPQTAAAPGRFLVYTSGAAGGNIGSKKHLTWFDRNCKSGRAVGMSADTAWASISRDGSTVATDPAEETGRRDIWLHDLARGTDTRFTFVGASNTFRVWSGDASRIAFTAVRGNGGTRYVKATNGVGEPEELDKDPRRIRIDDWSRDGRYIIEELADPKTLRDIWVVPQFGDKKPLPT